MCAAHLEEIARLALPEVMINESRLRAEEEEGLGTDVVEPGFSSLFDLVASRTTKLEQKSLAVVAQNLCAVLEAVHSSNEMYLGFLSAKTFYLSSDHGQFKIILNQEQVSKGDDDLEQFGRIVLGLCVLAFVDGEFDPEALRTSLIVPYAIPHFWQDVIGRCTTSDAFVKPSFVWIKERIARFMAEAPQPNEKNIDPFLYQKALDICALQSLLMDIFEESLDDTVGELLESPYVVDAQLVGSFVHYLIIAVFHRPVKVDLLVTLMNKLFARLDEAKVRLIKDTILKMFPEKPASAGAWSNASAQMYFLYKGLVTGMFLPDDIVRMIGDLCGVRDSQLRRVVLHLFAYFADIVEEVDRDLFDYIWDSITPELLGHISGVYGRFYGRRDALRKDDWKLLKQERSGEGDIRTILANDRVDELRDLASHPTFEFDKRIEPSLFEPVFMESSKPTLIQYAAFYGSVECFRYLLMSGADLSLTDDQDETVVHHAVAGGNIEIVRACEQSGCDFSGTLELAVRLYQHEIFDWLHATKFPDLNRVDRSLGSLTLNAAKTNNIRMILSAIENDWDVSTPDEYGDTPLMLAALFGYTDVVQLLLCDPRVDINHVAQHRVTALKLAVEFGHVDTVRVLLAHPDCDLEMENSFTGTAIPAVWSANSIGVLELLLEKMPNCHLVANRNGLTYVHRLIATHMRPLFDYVSHLITPEQAQKLNELPGWKELFGNKPEDNWLNELTKS